MKILIETTSDWFDTKISLNGRIIEDLKEFQLSVRAGKKAKLQMIREIAGRNEFLSYYGADFGKLDESV